MKNFKHYLLTVLFALVSCVEANAYDFEVDGFYYNIISEDENTCAVTYQKYTNYYYSSYSGDLKIPSSVEYAGKTYSVTRIGDHAFYNCTSLKSIEMPNCVTSIGYRAFVNCWWLTSIDIPNGVTIIEYEAFSGCKQLESIEIPNSVTTIGYSAFEGCSRLESIVIPNSVTSIGSSVFSGCSSLPVEDNIRYADTYLVEAVDKELSND